ncbi:hypothetical protein JCM10049v2_006058 [Rhodotorula toruloides]
MSTREDLEVLQILRSLPPLLSPDLPSPPPSRPGSPVKVDPAPLKRKHEEDGHRNGEEPSQRPTIGLGFEEGLDEVAAKRSRPAPPPPPAPPGRPPPPPPAALPSDLKPSTPDLRNSPRPASARLPLPKGSPMLGSPRVDREAEWRKEWPKERLRKLAAQCRDHGRKLKHAGDAIARTPHPSRKDILRALAHHIDSILLYIYSFWCDDSANRNCNVQQWESGFGLISFVRKMAEKENVALVVGLCTRMEAIAVFTTSMHEQKALNFRGTQLSYHRPSASSAPSSSSAATLPPRPPGPPPPPPPLPPPDHSAASPASTAATDSPVTTASPSTASGATSHPPPPSSAALSGTKPYEDFLRSFLRASPELFRFQRLYDDSCTILSPAFLSASFPETWVLCTLDPGDSPSSHPSAFILPNRPCRFAWPAELGRGTNAWVAHQVAWARKLVEEWAEREGLGYVPENVGEGV